MTTLAFIIIFHWRPIIGDRPNLPNKPVVIEERYCADYPVRVVRADSNT